MPVLPVMRLLKELVKSSSGPCACLTAARSGGKRGADNGLAHILDVPRENV